MVIVGGIEFFEQTLQPVMDFHNSAVYHGKAIQVDTDVENTSPLSQGEDVFPLSSSSVKKFTANLGNVESWSNEYKKEGEIGPGNSVCFGQPMVGLKLHMAKDSQNMSSATNSASSNTAKRPRASYQNSQTSRCQVEGCNVDLSTAKDYHRRHRICECHSKSPKVIVAGMERRFCQQCSRFHNLAEFDDKKRSCRRRLSDHNARRRRPQPEAMHLGSMGLTSSLYDRRPPSFLLNRLASSLSNTTWESSCSLKMTQGGSSLIRGSGTDGNGSAANSYMNEAPNLPRALSLLSATTSWGLNQPESTSLDPFMQGTASIAQPVVLLESQNWPLISAQHVSAEQAHSISPLQ